MSIRRKSSAPSSHRRTRRPLGLAFTATALLSAVTVLPAHAVAGPPDIPDLQNAVDTLKSTDVHNAVCRFLSVPVPQGGQGKPKPIPTTADPCAGQPSVTVGQTPLAVFEITSDFVSGKVLPTAATALQLSYVAAPVKTDSTRSATVLLGATQSGGWHLAAVRESDSDAGYAGKGTTAAPVFSEPQLHAWYQLTLDQVTPLNDAAKSGLGGKSSVSLADYQNLVKGRYADKMAGSDYATKGFSSGYQPTTGPSSHPSSPTPAILGGSGAAVALAGGLLALRRRRRATSS
ncbi:hypothetical protein CTZ27_02760 [Streptomyces griseocarneus]|nr:hypothetical protein CTZ27_02760 [Streptomyces griseocarneus]